MNLGGKIQNIANAKTKEEWDKILTVMITINIQLAIFSIMAYTLFIGQYMQWAYIEATKNITIEPRWTDFFYTSAIYSHGSIYLFFCSSITSLLGRICTPKKQKVFSFLLSSVIMLFGIFFTSLTFTQILR